MAHAQGAIHAGSFEAFESGVRRLLGQWTRHLVFDFDRVTYVNSRTWTFVLSEFKKLRAADGRTALSSLHGQVLLSYRLMGIDRAIRAYSDIAAAVDAVLSVTQP